MKVLDPSPLAREAADVLGDLSGKVVVVGAVALEAALSGRDARTAATSDVDGAVNVDSAAAVIARLEEAGLAASTEPHERGFTWVREGLKVQLMRPPARVSLPPARHLVANTQFALAKNYTEWVAFAERPDEPRLRVARPAAVLALKCHAFGRTRPDGGLVERDYHDAFMLIAHLGEEIAAEYNGTDDGQLRGFVRKSVADLGSDEARRAVRNQTTRLEPGVSPREADLQLTRAVRALARRLR